MNWSKADFDAMDLRLKNWAVWCRAGEWSAAMWESDARRGIAMTRDQIADAMAVQLMVMRLPIEMRLVCQVHYVSRPVEPENGRGETRVDEVNRRLRAAGVHRRMNADHYRYVRERAISNMLNGSQCLTAPISSVKSASNGFGIRTSLTLSKA